MYAYNRSDVAYDLSRFDTGEPARRPEEKPAEAVKPAEPAIKMHKVSIAKTGNWFKTVFFVAFAALLAFAIINSKAVISEISTEISTQNALLEEAKSENANLQSRLDNMVTLSKVEEIAVGELGLQKTAKNQVHYISIYDRTMVQAAQSETNVFVSLKNWLDGAMEYLGF
ncbi:MAG: hypothetical protein J1F60_01195 [Oscillospiraceae bacterium]|nr:hypothetical protein [Oscillospiraceae bacterium]